jgi:hypothetical protein
MSVFNLSGGFLLGAVTAFSIPTRTFSQLVRYICISWGVKIFDKATWAFSTLNILFQQIHCAKGKVL